MIFSLILAAFLLPAQAETPEQAARLCFHNEVELYLASKGRLPTEDEADLIIDYCMGEYEKARKEEKSKSSKEK